jgi:hypothetical protein
VESHPWTRGEPPVDPWRATRGEDPWTVCVPPRDKHKHEHKHELCLTPVTHLQLYNIAYENRAAIGDGAPVESRDPWRIYLGKELYPSRPVHSIVDYITTHPPCATTTWTNTN